MYKRECEKMAKGLARSVPKLREIHVIRDAWTKLNVAPAKIMQVYTLIRSVQNVHSLQMTLYIIARKCIDRVIHSLNYQCS